MFELSGFVGLRKAVLFGGLIGLLVLAIATQSRGVEGAEVFSLLLYAPILVAFLKYDVPGGIVGGLVALLLYITTRRSALNVVGNGQLISLFARHGAAYLLFGVIGGLANATLRDAPPKTDPASPTDIETGLYSARFFLDVTESELARAARYDSRFSVTILDIPAPPLDHLSRSQRSLLLVEMGKMLRGGVRTVDRVVIAHDAVRYRVAAILPETGADGAQIFERRFADRLAEFLLGYGVAIAPRTAMTATVPGDEETVERIRREFEDLDRR